MLWKRRSPDGRRTMTPHPQKSTFGEMRASDVKRRTISGDSVRSRTDGTSVGI
jgi:hypothetical protein